MIVIALFLYAESLLDAFDCAAATGSNSHASGYNCVMGTITELLKQRYSVRNFQQKAVPAHVLQEILEAGRLSPSGGNEQPWRFYIVTDPAVITQIAAIAHHQNWIAQSPLLIVLCTVFVEEEKIGGEIQAHRYPEYTKAVADIDPNLYRALNQEEHQTKIAGTHMALAALEHGVGSCWVSRFEVRRLADLLDVPQNVLPSEILVLGYSNRQHTQSPKKSLEEIAVFVRGVVPDC